MFCKSCGKQIDDDSTFCTFCGKKQSKGLEPFTQSDTKQSNNTTQKDNSTETTNNNSSNVDPQPKYDPTYKKENNALIIGVILLITPIIFAIVGPIKLEEVESYNQFRVVSIAISFTLRISLTVWVVNIAKRQNRETFGWGIFAFLLPSIALIVVALNKKLFAQIHIIDGLENDQNSKILSDQAQEFFDNNKYSECIRFSEKAINLNTNNEIAKDILKKSKLAIAEINNVNSSTQTVFKELANNKLLEIVTRLNQTIGSEVYIDNSPAPDGVYNLKSGSHKIIVKGGKIIKQYYINRFNNFFIEQLQGYMPTKGDNVFLTTGESAPTGKYSMGLFSGSVKVENGKFIGW